ncbi:MAG TPA: prephenate dehydrogenase/arogenate dehydrogenase family protein [Firmicutes bacterium]|jgi:prephenate dehydrogenase|nr:prephenate dehydrogenase/arogenate dehydrogenase family protein [Bacillota bacterium]
MTAVKDTPIAVLGLGLMGGSLALALTHSGFTVAGWDENPDVVREAFRIGATQRISLDLKDAVAGAKVVFIATPVAFISKMIQNTIPYTTPGTIFSDLGSIKESIIHEVFSFLPETHYFVAGHPMTGSEQQGIQAADPFLFQNAAYLLIDHPRTPVSILEDVVAIIRTTGAHILKLAASEHDRIVAMVSHLPHLLAATLAKTAGTDEEQHPGTLGLAAGGFRDTTRIAMGAPEVWEGIILGNRRRIIQAIEDFQSELDGLKRILNVNDHQGLRTFLEKARGVRAQIPAKNKGFLTLLYEMVVTIEDRSGTIESVLHHLAEAGLNIKDIEILRVREGEGGTLRLALENSQAVDEAIKVLEKQGFKVRRR